MRPILFMLMLMLAALSGCATQTGNTRANIQAGMNACLAATKQTRALAIEVPSTNNALSNKLLVATIKMSGSTTVDTLVSTLSLSSRPPVIAFGDNDEVIAATLEAALSKLPPNTVRSAEPLCFTGATEFFPALQKSAEAAGVRLLTIRN